MIVTCKGRNIKISKHALVRYVERVKGIKSNREVKIYIAMNECNLTRNLEKMIQFSNLIYKGQLFNNTTKSYHLVDNIILVMDVRAKELVTIYRVDFGLSSNENRQTLSRILVKISRLKKQLSSISDFVRKRQVQQQIEDYIKLICGLGKPRLNMTLKQGS